MRHRIYSVEAVLRGAPGHHQNDDFLQGKWVEEPTMEALDGCTLDGKKFEKNAGRLLRVTGWIINTGIPTGKPWRTLNLHALLRFTKLEDVKKMWDLGYAMWMWWKSPEIGDNK